MNGENDGEGVTDSRLDDPESWGWVGELAEGALKSTGVLSLELLTQGSRWVNRRVETIELIDELRVRQQVSIDFRLPERLPGSLPLAGGSQYVLPLLFLPRRSDLAYFDVRDESERALPVLTRQENARLTGLIMITAAERAVATSTGANGKALELSEALRAYLAAIPTRPLRRALTMAGEIVSRESFLYPDERVAHALLADATFCDLLGVCQYSSAVHIPLSASPGERRIVKISWEGRWDNPGEAKGGGCRKRLAGGWRKLQRFAGWRAQMRVLDTPQVGSAESHHIQISVPPGVELTEASCRNGPPRVMLPGGETEQIVKGERDPYQPFAAAIAPHVHLYIPRAYEARAGLLEVGLRSARHSLLPAAIVTGLLVTALLALYTARADEIVGQSEPGAAILLLVPAVLAGFLVRPDEHAMARMLLRGPRLMTTALGILPLIAAATLVSALGGEDGGLLGALFGVNAPNAPGALVLLWGLLAGAALVLTLGLIASMVLPQRRRKGTDDTKPPSAPAHDAESD